MLRKYKDFDILATYQALVSTYSRHRMVVEEFVMGYPGHGNYGTARHIVDRFDRTIANMPEKYRFILENEIQKGKSGTWYLDYMSKSTYYRNRMHIYELFIRELDR